MPHGVFRRVLLVGPLAIKFPRWKYFSQGRRCNRWEREMWRVWKPRFEWTHLCPVLLADRLGCVVVMRRAQQPITEQEMDAVLNDHPYPGDTAECKEADHGRLDARIVAVDYGLPDEDMVEERRAYYRGFGYGD